MNKNDSPRAKSRGKPERELRPEHLVQVRSLDARRRLGEVSNAVAEELVRRRLCTEKFSGSGKRQYLRLLVSEDELPVEKSKASLMTTRHVQGQGPPGSEHGVDYYEHRFPGSVAIIDRVRRKTPN
jgi:hypothetical protein